MTLPDWNTMQFYQWLAIGGGILLALSFALYFGAPNQGVRVPAGILIAVGGLGAGVGLGVILMGSLGYRWQQQEMPSQSPPGGAGGGGMAGMMMRPPDPKAQLSALITKLDLLTGKPPALSLDKELRQKVRDQVKDLDEKKELPVADAQKRLEALLTLLKDQRETLVSVGYRWPQQRAGMGAGGGPPGGGSRGGPPGGGPPGGARGGPGGGPRPPLPNPFRDDDKAKEHLNHLRDHLKAE